MSLIAALGIVSVGTVISTSLFLSRRKTRSAHSIEDGKKEVVTLTLRGLNDIDMICETINRGNVVILGVKDLARLDMIRLKRSIQQLKSHMRITGGDIFMLGKEFVVLVPNTMKLSFIRNLMEGPQEDNHPPEPPTEVGTI